MNIRTRLQALEGMAGAIRVKPEHLRQTKIIWTRFMDARGTGYPCNTDEYQGPGNAPEPTDQEMHWAAGVFEAEMSNRRAQLDVRAFVHLRKFPKMQIREVGR